MKAIDFMKNKLSVVGVHMILIFISALCLFPMILVISISISNDTEMLTSGYRLIPKVIDFAAYQLIFKSAGGILRAYAVTAFVTCVGTIGSLLLVSSFAYVISRRDFRYRRFFSLFIFIPMLFNGGIVPTFILVSRTLNLYDTIGALILPYLVVPWFVLLMKGYMQEIPHSLIESAKIDGASEFKVFVSIILPISKVAMATIGFFSALLYWNDWWLGLLYIETKELFPLQVMLQKMMSNIQFLTSGIMANANVSITIKDIPTLSARMAMCMIAAGPILVLFPFFQKYFVKGITVGAVKG